MRSNDEFLPLFEEPRSRPEWHPIRPDQITDFTGTFGKHEVERSAERIVEFFKERGRWCEFTLAELMNYFDRRGWDPEPMFFGLLGGWFNDSGMGGDWDAPQHTYFVFGKGGGCAVTDKFVEVCGKNVMRRAA